jgi:hypothetical protein
LEDQLEVKALHTQLDQTSLKISSHLVESAPIIPQGVAIGIRTVTSGRRYSQINLRRGEFAYVQNYENIFKYAVNGAKVLAFGMMLMMFSYGVKYFFYNSQTNALKEQYRKELVESFPSMRKKYGSGNVDFTAMARDAERTIRGEINQRKRAVEFFVAQNSGSVPLMLLKKVSEALPKEVKVDVTSFDYKGGEAGVGKLSIKGETDNYDTHSQILKAFQAIADIQEVKDAGTSFKPGSNQKVLQFRITATHQIAGADDKRG